MFGAFVVFATGKLTKGHPMKSLIKLFAASIMLFTLFVPAFASQPAADGALYKLAFEATPHNGDLYKTISLGEFCGKAQGQADEFEFDTSGTDTRKPVKIKPGRTMLASYPVNSFYPLFSNAGQVKLTPD